MKGKFDLEAKFEKAAVLNCFISEITLAELKFGVEKSEKPEKNKKALDNFLLVYKYSPFSIPLTCMRKRKHDCKRQEQ